MIPFERSIFDLDLRAFCNLEHDVTIARIAAFKQRDLNKVVALVLVFTFNTIDRLVISPGIEWTASLQACPCLQMLDLDLLISAEFHALYDRLFMNGINQNQPLRRIVETFIHIEEPSRGHQ